MIRLTGVPKQEEFGLLPNGTKVRVKLSVPHPTPQHAKDLIDGDIVEAEVLNGEGHLAWSFYLVTTGETNFRGRRYLFPHEYRGVYLQQPNVLNRYAKAKILEVIE